MGTCPASSRCTSAWSAGLQYARAHRPVDCGVVERLLGGFAICMGALPCGLWGARALARRVCKMHGRLPNKLHDALHNEKVLA
ncbi:hypothetical protein CRG98_006369 [Punica granatum]|uniref:Uncharacterized protein n=1 Tax=Punica granatum TaxID=22663 RepID=A0A2I0KXP5_PUNGR|nr:hypothetical protein CRG98_006369 [Punica granatum]